MNSILIWRGLFLKRVGEGETLGNSERRGGHEDPLSKYLTLHGCLGGTAAGFPHCWVKPERVLYILQLTQTCIRSVIFKGHNAIHNQAWGTGKESTHNGVHGHQLLNYRDEASLVLNIWIVMNFILWMAFVEDGAKEQDSMRGWTEHFLPPLSTPQ